MVFTLQSFDNRRQDSARPVALVVIDTHGAQEDVTTFTIPASSPFLQLQGTLKQYAYIAPNLTTDTQFSFQILDQDSCIFFDSGNIDDSKTVPFYVRLTAANSRLFAPGKEGYYKIKYTWTTSQNIAANAFKLALLFTNEY